MLCLFSVWYGGEYWRMWLYGYRDICSTGGLAGHHCVGNIRFYCSEYLLQKEVVRRNGEIHVTDGKEVEFGIVESSWITMPLDTGTYQVLSDGYKTSWTRSNILKI